MPLLELAIENSSRVGGVFDRFGQRRLDDSQERRKGYITLPHEDDGKHVDEAPDRSLPPCRMEGYPAADDDVSESAPPPDLDGQDRKQQRVQVGSVRLRQAAKRFDRVGIEILCERRCTVSAGQHRPRALGDILIEGFAPTSDQRVEPAPPELAVACGAVRSEVALFASVHTRNLHDVGRCRRQTDLRGDPLWLCGCYRVGALNHFRQQGFEMRRHALYGGNVKQSGVEFKCSAQLSTGLLQRKREVEGIPGRGPYQFYGSGHQPR